MYNSGSPERDHQYGHNSQHSVELGEAQPWDMKFQNLWSLIIASDADFLSNMTLSEKLFHLVGQFNHEVNVLVTQIVNDFSLPVA